MMNFDRYHVGESMLPSLRQFLQFVDCEEKVKNYGFCVKVSSRVLISAPENNRGTLSQVVPSNLPTTRRKDVS